MARYNIEKISDYKWQVPKDEKTGMRVPAIIFADTRVLGEALQGNTLDQVVNVSTLPGIIKASLAMPDIHFGYGFPIGGVAGFSEEDGIISPGGVGFDISCGVRLLKTDLAYKDIRKDIEKIVYTLFSEVPTGVGSKGKIRLKEKDMDDLLYNGAGWAISNGFGSVDDAGFIEDSGMMKQAFPENVSAKAKTRGKDQLGTLGSGNHFLEVQRITEIIDAKKAETMGLFKGQVTIMIHSGSRGLGHQVCSDYIKTMLKAVSKYGIDIPDRQLACAPILSDEGKRYYSAMSCAANYAMANRQCLAHWVRDTFEKVLGIPWERLGIGLVYDVSHNTAKIESHVHKGKEIKICVHRKGATRSFAPGHKDIPQKYKGIGQPVIVPGDMGRYSFVLAGTEASMKETFGSTCHGAGRRLSRSKAKKIIDPNKVKKDLLKDKNIIVLSKNSSGLAEEAPQAYKDVKDIVRVVEGAGISEIVAMLEPVGVIKG